MSPEDRAVCEMFYHSLRHSFTGGSLEMAFFVGPDELHRVVIVFDDEDPNFNLFKDTAFSLIRILQAGCLERFKITGNTKDGFTIEPNLNPDNPRGGFV